MVDGRVVEIGKNEEDSNKLEKNVITLTKKKKNGKLMVERGDDCVNDCVNDTESVCNSSQESPWSKASWFSRLFYLWFTPLTKLGTQKTLDEKDIWKLPLQYTCSQVYAANIECWQEELKKKNPCFGWMLFKAFRLRILYGFLFFLLHLTMLVVQPLIVQALLRYLNDDSSSSQQAKGYWMALGLACSALLGALSLSCGFDTLARTGLNMRTFIMDLVYRKALVLSPCARRKISTGEIVTLMNVDADRVNEAIIYIHRMWLGPVAIIISLILVGTELGAPSALSGAIAMTCMISLSIYIAKLVGNLRLQLVHISEERIKVTSEILQGIRVVKFYVWENIMLEKIRAIRKRELALLKKFLYFRVINTVLLILGPVLTCTFCFIVYGALGGILSVEKAFTTLGFIGLSSFSSYALPGALASGSEAIVALHRIGRYLLEDELESFQTPLIKSTSTLQHQPQQDHQQQNHQQQDPPHHHSGSSTSLGGKSPSISISKGCFCWSKEVGHKEEEEGHKEEEEASGSSDSLKLLIDELHIDQGSLVMVVGSVGSGKSSFLWSLLGEIHKLHGNLKVVGNVLHASQEPWIFKSSIRSNVLFEETFDSSRYSKVIQAVQLHRDLQTFANNDFSPTGERGSNLSGGQKARLSLARVLYRQNIDIYLLDDPLSAVDAHVAKKIFEECILGLMSKKTRILVLNSHHHFLPYADRILVFEEGKIIGDGTFQSLCQNVLQNIHEHESTPTSKYQEPLEPSLSTDPPFLHPLPHHPPLHPLPLDDTPISISLPSLNPLPLHPLPIHSPLPVYHPSLPVVLSNRSLSSTNEEKQQHSLHTDHDATNGNGEGNSIGLELYTDYFQHAGHGKLLFFGILLTFVVGQTCRVAVDWWLGHWAQNASNGFSKNMNIYIFLSGTVAIVYLGRSLFFIAVCLKSSQTLHDHLLIKVLEAPINLFFDVTPLGQILNRFSKDLDYADSILPEMLIDFLQNICNVVGVLVIIAISSPWIVLIYLPILYIFFTAKIYFQKTSRELKRIEAQSRTPVFSCAAETLNGVETIRTFQMTTTYIHKNHCAIDNNTGVLFNFEAAGRWICVRLDALSAALVALVGCFLVTTKGSFGPSLGGLALVYCLQLTIALQWTVRVACLTENAMTSIERLLHMKNIPSEIPFYFQNKTQYNRTKNRTKNRNNYRTNNITHDDRGDRSDDDDDRGADRDPTTTSPSPITSINETVVDSHWPKEGRIEIQGMYLRYRPELDYVLKNVSLLILPKQKIGICGRSGAGKSSLLCALFRIVELEKGQILIDGINLATVSLSILRSRLSIIPQDPVLFSGTIRHNLDPLNQWDDLRIWHVLDQVKLKTYVQTRPYGLNTFIKEGGGNLSLGQRQLLCIGRALLKNSRVIIMDEATANVDHSTDQLIQATIKEAFKEQTVLTIAHRLETIKDCDSVAVFDSGTLKEFQNPHVLIQQPNSLYRALAIEAGLLKTHAPIAA